MRVAVAFKQGSSSSYELDHLVAAIFDRVSFSGGAKVLLNDLRARGWDV
jgi:hypothetical protein